ncbi:MAG TPA: lytic transglycosylase domain-containing protein [Roseiarcus sp.]|nr:lytic transglycosylase domain-containing protein [Roseiarcus sp.]
MSGGNTLKPQTTAPGSESGAASGEIRVRGSRRIGALLIAAVAASSAAPAFAAEAAPSTDDALARLCGIVETAARQEGLPVGFFARLIWRESAFHSGAVSPAGAQGVAQFMPGSAADRGLADPFDPAAAIPASATLLAELARRFGNLGLAAAAYNAGPNALADWLAGKGVLPLETQDYVLAVTGHDVEEWRGAKPPSPLAPDPDKPCLASVGDLRFARGLDASRVVSGRSAPWGAPTSGRARPGYYNTIGHMQLLRLAADAHMTAGAYVLLALKERGLDRKDDKLFDRRKAQSRQ